MEDDVPEITSFFSKRAKFVPELSHEKLQAAAKLLEEIHEEKEKSNVTDDTKGVPAKKRGRRKVSAENKSAKPEENKSAKPEEIALDEDLEFCSPPVALSAAAKRRLRKLQRDCDKELKRVEEANEKVLSSLSTSSVNEVEIEDIDNCEKERILTILYLSEVSRLKYDENESFSTIFPRIADLFKLNISEFLLCFKDKNIKVDDTPESLNLVPSDILECIPYKTQGENLSKYEDNKLKLLFQASDIKQKTEFLVHKLDKMQDVMERYSKTRNILLDQMVFEFDGEPISGTETPLDMDMESGSCIDVKILNASDKQSRKESTKKSCEVIDLSNSDDSNSGDPIIVFCE